MKSIFLTFLCFFATLPLIGQIEYNPSPEPLPTVYLGVGTGISNFTGLLGVSCTINATDQVAIRGAAGIGGWGYKYSFGINYHKNYLRGWNYGLSYSHYTGMRGMQMDMEVNSGNTQEVTIDYQPTGTLNLTMAYSWKLGRKNSFYLEYGYAIAMENKPWEVTSGEIFSSKSQQVMNLVRPGGLMLGVGFTFGLK